MCTCKFVRVCSHIKNPKNMRPSQIIGPERDIGEDAAPPTCYPSKEAKKKRSGPPGACRKQEADLIDLDLRHWLPVSFHTAIFPLPPPTP